MPKHSLLALKASTIAVAVCLYSAAASAQDRPIVPAAPVEGRADRTSVGPVADRPGGGGPPVEDVRSRDQADEAPTIFVVGQRDAPITVEPRGLAVSLGQEQFAGVNAVNVEDLMRYAPNFFIRKRFIGDNNASASFRGATQAQSARSLVLVDGFVISNFLGSVVGSFAPKWGVVGPGEVRQFDIVYGPYSARYPGNSMGGIVSITTCDPKALEAYVNVQGFLQTYNQYATKGDYAGYTIEGGIGGAQENGPWSGRVSYRRLENRSHPIDFRRLVPATGVGGIVVTGAVVDPDLPPPTTPIYATSSPLDVVHDQVRARVGYDAGSFRADAFLSYWWNQEKALRPGTYLRDSAGQPVYQGLVRFNGQPYNATAVNLTLFDKEEYLAGVRLAGEVGAWKVRANLSRFGIVDQRTRASNDYQQGVLDGAGSVTRQEGTGWWTGDLLVERQLAIGEVAFGLNSNLYTTRQDRFNTTNWRAETNPTFANQVKGKTSLVGLYVEQQVVLSDTIRATIGARYDFWRAFNGGVGRSTVGGPRFQVYGARRAEALNGAFSVEADLPLGIAGQISIATATRFPTVGELFQGVLTSVGEFDINSFDPNLKPERSRDANLILRRDFGRVALTTSVFYQSVRDTIYSQTGFNQFGILTTSFQNIDETRSLGLEVLGEARQILAGLDIDANIAIVDSKVVRNPSLKISEGVQLPRIPRYRINANARYTVLKDLQASLGWRYASRPNSNLEGTLRGGTYGYTTEFSVFDARLTYQLPYGARLAVGVDNFTNNVAFVGHPFPNRTFLVELGWRY